MEGKEISLVQKLLDLYEQSQKIDKKEDATFLSVIQKDYYENYLSRLIAYALSIDNNCFIKNLLKRYKEEKGYAIDLSNLDSKPEIICEKNMDGRRADIFIEFKSAKVTVTIENKTNTEEHDDQTQFYFNWVKNQHKYKGYTNIFFYLCPNYNISKAGCEDYVNITYSDLAKMIPEDTKDFIVKDLKKHIEQKLGVENMELKNYVIEIIKNYDIFQDIVSTAKTAIKAYQTETIDKIKEILEDRFKFIDWKAYNKDDPKQNTDKTLLVDIKYEKDAISSYRFYRPKWYKEDKYYFYVELLFHYEAKDSYGDIRGVKYQQTVLTYSNQDLQNTLKEIPHCNQVGKCFVFVSEESRINSDSGAWTYEKWKAEWRKNLIEEAPNILQKYIEEMDNRFRELCPDSK